MKVGGEAPSAALVEPCNLRRTWLPKVHTEQVKKLQDIVRNGSYFVAIGADETDDPRPSNAYIVTVEVQLLPKEITEDYCVKTFHLQLEFPTEVNNETLSTTIDKVHIWLI